MSVKMHLAGGIVVKRSTTRQVLFSTCMLLLTLTLTFSFYQTTANFCILVVNRKQYRKHFNVLDCARLIVPH